MARGMPRSHLRKRLTLVRRHLAVVHNLQKMEFGVRHPRPRKISGIFQFKILISVRSRLTWPRSKLAPNLRASICHLQMRRAILQFSTNQHYIKAHIAKGLRNLCYTLVCYQIVSYRYNYCFSHIKCNIIRLFISLYSNLNKLIITLATYLLLSALFIYD